MEEPNKWIRQYFSQALSNMVVNGKIVKVYDTHTPNNDDVLIILSTQTGSNDREDKCSISKNRTIEIQVITRYKGITGSRLLLDDICEEIQTRVKNITIPNFTLWNWDVSFPQDFATSTETETIFRKIINYNLKLK
jgi:hypothetical protein